MLNDYNLNKKVRKNFFLLSFDWKKFFFSNEKFWSEIGQKKVWNSFFVFPIEVWSEIGWKIVGNERQVISSLLQSKFHKNSNYHCVSRIYSKQSDYLIVLWKKQS